MKASLKISVNGRCGTPVNGTDRPATAEIASGRLSAVFQTIGAPQSWPIRIAGASGCSALATPATSPVSCSIE